jgi:hypothetical protein
LSLLSFLPDGLSDVELLQSKLTIQDIWNSKTALVATSLAYIDNKKRLRALMPIREHIKQFSPPSQFLMHPLRRHFYLLLHLYRKYEGEQLMGLVNQITLNLGNLQELLYLGMHPDDPDLTDTTECIFNLSSFYRVTERGFNPLMDNIPALFSHHSDHRLEVQFITELLMTAESQPISNPETVIAKGISCCEKLDDPRLEGESNIICPHVLLRCFCDNR